MANGTVPFIVIDCSGGWGYVLGPGHAKSGIRGCHKLFAAFHTKGDVVAKAAHGGINTCQIGLKVAFALKVYFFGDARKGLHIQKAITGCQA